MKCQNIEQILSARLEGEATASQWRLAEEHLAACQRCAQTWRNFQASTHLYKSQLPQLEPAPGLWNKISARLRETEAPARPAAFAEWWSRLGELVLPQTPRALYWAKLGFAVLVLALAGLPMVFKRSQQTAVATRTLAGKDTPLAEARLPRANARPVSPQPVASTNLEQQLASYLEETRVILLEVKNSTDTEQVLDVHEIRRASQRLLEQTVILKADLKEEKAAVLQNLMDQLEMTLWDLANLEEHAPPEDVDMVRATIRQNDLLIKIEIFDLKTLERNRAPKPNSPATPRAARKTVI